MWPVSAALRLGRVGAVCVLLGVGPGADRASGQPAGAPQPRAAQGETVYVNANVYTADPARPRAGAIAVRDGVIVEVGPSEALRVRHPRAGVVDLAGRTVLPGLIDAHGHMAGLGELTLSTLDLTGVASEEAMVALAVERAKTLPPGAWVVGRNWDHERWPGRRLPTRAALSAALPDNPVFLERVDGHSAVANDAALARAGLTPQTQAPAGGAILRDPRGEPTGVLIDNAMELVTRVIDAPAPPIEDLLLEAQRRCVEAGLTGVHDMSVSVPAAEAYQRLDESGRLVLHVNVYLASAYAPGYFAARPPTRTDRLHIAGAKAYADGALGSRGAWLLEPYADRPADDRGNAYTGLAVTAPEQIRDLAAHALERGYQLVVHGIGDRANRQILDAFEAALAQGPDRAQPPRFRVEHAQVLSPSDVPRFGALGVIASVQPTHCTSDMRWVPDRLGPERSRGAYAWASVLRAGGRLAGGSDFPVESHNPFLGFYAAVTRQDASGWPEGGWHPEERLTREEALRVFTIDAAYAGFREQRQGSITPGKAANFIVIDRDVMTCPAAEIPATRVLRTVIDGQTVHDAGPKNP